MWIPYSWYNVQCGSVAMQKFGGAWYINIVICESDGLSWGIGIGPTVTVSKFKGGGVVNNRNTSAGFYNCGPPVIHSSPLNSQFAANYCVYVPIHLRHVAISLHFNISNTLALDSYNLCLFHSHFLRLVAAIVLNISSQIIISLYFYNNLSFP